MSQHIRIRIELVQPDDLFINEQPNGGLLIMRFASIMENGLEVRHARITAALIKHLNSVAIPMPTK